MFRQAIMIYKNQKGGKILIINDFQIEKMLKMISNDSIGKKIEINRSKNTHYETNKRKNCRNNCCVLPAVKLHYDMRYCARMYRNEIECLKTNR